MLKYEVSAVPLQDQVGHVRHWGIQVYQNGMVRHLVYVLPIE